MRHWPFASAETHRLFDLAELERALRDGGFRDETMAIASVRITQRVAGLIATATVKPLGERQPPEEETPTRGTFDHR